MVTPLRRRGKGLGPRCPRGVSLAALDGLPLERYYGREKEIPLSFKLPVFRPALLQSNIISNCQRNHKYFDFPVLETCCL